MSLLPQKLGKAALYGFIIWISGFVWGTIVFMIPTLKGLRAIPYVSTNPSISIPIIILWIFLATRSAKSYLKTSSRADNEALKLGFSFFGVNFIMDLLVLVIAFGNGSYLQ